VGDFAELGSYCIVDFFDPVAMDVAPERAYAVDVTVAFGVDQVEAFCGIYDDRVGFEPVGHLCERVPEVVLVGFDQVFRKIVHRGLIIWLIGAWSIDRSGSIVSSIVCKFDFVHHKDKLCRNWM